MMEQFLHTVSFIFIPLIGIYIGYVFYYFWGLYKLAEGTNRKQYTVSVIIPARNEEHTIIPCLTALISQNYPKELYEIVIVDDCSTDGTAKKVSEFSAAHSETIKLLTVNDRKNLISPKINALSVGIEQSAGDLILTTDADCIASQQWISSIVSHFDDGVGVVTGLTAFKSDPKISDIFSGIQFLDFISYTAVGAGAIGNGAINICNGSNMAFRRNAFTDIGGFSSLAHLNTGDDSLLGQQIVRSKKWSARFVINPFSFVATLPVSSWKSFFSQRMRWAGQTTEYPADSLVFMINTFFLYILLFVSLPAGAIAGNFFPVIVWLLKTSADYIIMRKFCSLTNTEKALKYFIPTALLHIPVIIFSVLGGFFGQFTWKERTIGRTVK